MSAFSTASKTRMWEPYIRWKGRVPFYWCHNPYWRTCHQILFMSISLALCDDCSTLLSFLWSSYDTWWLLYRCRVCFYVHSRHPNSLLLPGMYDCQMDWTEVHQSRPKQDKYTGTCKQIDKTVYRNSLYIFIILFVHLFSWIFIFFSFIAFQSMGASSTRNQSFFFLQKYEILKNIRNILGEITWQASTPPVSTPAHIIRDVICPPIKVLHTVLFIIRTWAFWSTVAAIPESHTKNNHY